MDRIPSWRVEGSLSASVYSDYYKCQKGGQNFTSDDDFDYSEQTLEREKPSWMNNRKVETYQTSLLEDKRKTDTQIKQKNQPDLEVNNSGTDEDLIALLKVTMLLTSSLIHLLIIQFLSEI